MAEGGAYTAALKVLGRRDYSASELEQRLRRKGFEPEEIAGAIARCRELGYLDDERYARRFASERSRARGWGPARIEAELRRRGIGLDLAQRSAAEHTDDGALQIALRRAARRQRDGWWRLPERRQRMVQSLLRRGFEASEAIAAVERLAAELEDDEHARDDE